MKHSLCSGFAALCMSIAAVAFAQPTGDYPIRPVKLIVPSAPGGGADAFGRLLGDQLSKRLKQPIVVDNIAGAAGTIAIGQLAHARPDGYTIALGTM
uniref:Bug family tripartite tricarboxylate transporter substrate binding protein n=2 Tax=Burkholderiaceae TaxID=119060 RepID=UPI000AF2900C